MNWTLDIGQQRHEIVDAEQLRKELLVAHQVAKREPVIALLNAPDGSTLAIGLGLERSVLTYIAAGGWPSRHATDEAAGDRLVQYRLAGQMSEVPVCGTIRLEDAIDACVDYVKTGRVTSRITWEDD